MSPAADPAIRPAASAVIIRDAREGLEVFMMERNRGAGMAFAGAFVFPGGKVDAEDHAESWSQLAPNAGLTPPRAFWIAAIRETFEEAGLLLARRSDAGQRRRRRGHAQARRGRARPAPRRPQLAICGDGPSRAAASRRRSARPFRSLDHTAVGAEAFRCALLFDGGAGRAARGARRARVRPKASGCVRVRPCGKRTKAGARWSM